MRNLLRIIRKIIENILICNLLTWGISHIFVSEISLFMVFEKNINRNYMYRGDKREIGYKCVM